MGLPKTYFHSTSDAPPPLSATAERRVHFEEVDMLGIVWHGHYVSYLDDGRIAFGDKFGLSYSAMRDVGIVAPIAQMHIDYISPLRFDEIVTVEAILHWTDSMRLNFEYKLTSRGHVAARGYAVQLFVDLEGKTLFCPPEFIANFRQKWKNGEF